MGSFSIGHWLIVLVVVLVLFGTRKLRTVGSDLGGAFNSISTSNGKQFVGRAVPDSYIWRV